MNPPIVCAVTIPNTQNTTKTTASIQSSICGPFPAGRETRERGASLVTPGSHCPSGIVPPAYRLEVCGPRSMMISTRRLLALFSAVLLSVIGLVEPIPTAEILVESTPFSTR